MFEEAILYRRSYSNHSQSNGSLLKHPKHPCSDILLTLSQGETAICQHKHHKCLIRLWLAQGLIKTSVKWFLYVEYQDPAGNNRYLQKTFNSKEEAMGYAENEALNQTLPMV